MNEGFQSGCRHSLQPGPPVACEEQSHGIIRLATGAQEGAGAQGQPSGTQCKMEKLDPLFKSYWEFQAADSGALNWAHGTLCDYMSWP